MDLSGLLLIGGVLSYVGFIIYIANQIDAVRAVQTSSPYTRTSYREEPVERHRWVESPMLMRWLLYGLIAMMLVLGLTVLQTALFGSLASEVAEAALLNVSVAAGVTTFVAAAASCLLSFRLLTSPPARLMLQQILGRWGGNYNAESQVHLVAAILMLAVVVWTLANLVFQGGVEGLAQDIQETGVEAGDVVFQAVLEIVITLLGVGLAIRRGWAATVQRLGLRWPTLQDVLWGIGIGVFLLVTMIVFNLVWSSLVSPDMLEEQTSAAEQLSLAFATLPLAFILAVSAALGEEIWIRGGLQPVFGLLVSSLFFTILHIQLAFTPALLLILIVSFGLGWLRQRYSTTAAVIAHFCFNFVQLALLALAIEAV